MAREFAVGEDTGPPPDRGSRPGRDPAALLRWRAVAYELLRLTDPSRLALDVSGVKLATTVHQGPSGPFATLRAGAHPDKVRLVVDGRTGLEGRVSFSPHGLRWTMACSVPVAPAVAASAGSAAPTRGLKDGEVEIDGRVVTPAVAVRAGAGTAARRHARPRLRRVVARRPDPDQAEPAGPVRGGAPRRSRRGPDPDRRPSPQAPGAQPRHLGARLADQDDQHLPGAWRRAAGPGGGLRRWGPQRARRARRRRDRLAPRGQGAEDRGGGGVEPRRGLHHRARGRRRAGRHRPHPLLGQEGLVRVQGHRHPQPAAGHRRGEQEEHRRRRRRHREDHHPPAERPLGRGPGHHPGQQGSREGGDWGHPPRRPPEDPRGGGAPARGAEEGTPPTGGAAWSSSSR